METYKCIYQNCPYRAEWLCKCNPQLGLFCFSHMQNHMSEKQSTHHLDKIYNAPVEGTKDWIIDSLSRKAKELEIVKSETLNKYSQVFAQSQNSIKKGLKIIDDGVNYCQEKIAKVIEATEISIFERDEILLSLSREPEEALKIVTNEISKIQVKDKVRFYALLDGDLEQLITGKISKELDEKINDLINENKRLNERLKALEEGNNDQKALDPILIQEQFDIQNKSLRDAESKLEKTIQDIEVLKNKTEKLQETISRNQKGEIGRIDEIQNPIQNQEESKEAQAGLIIDKSPASLPVQSEINYIPSDEEAEKLSSLFGFSTKVARWMLTHIGSYINAQSLLLELLDQNKGNQGRNIDALAENLAHNLAKNPDLNVLKAMAEETLDYEEILLIAAGNDIERAFFYTTNLEMFSKAYKKAYEKSINSNN